MLSTIDLFYYLDHLKGQLPYKKTAMEMLVLFLKMEKSRLLPKIHLLQGKFKTVLSNVLAVHKFDGVCVH